MMMKAAYVMGMALALAGGMVRADDLADAEKLAGAKNYAAALPIYTKLANAGNAKAQYQLGEIYWYGAGVPADSAKADEWFHKADQAGYPEAKAALALTPKRQARQAEIDFYVQRYEGADVALSNFGCAKPEIPATSQTAQQIKSVSDRVDGWMSCYDGFLKNLANQLPAGKAIPDELANLMTDAEMQQATLRMDKAYAAVNASGKQQADQILAAREAWRVKTDDDVKTSAARAKQMIADQERIGANLSMQATAKEVGRK
ncbi:tetratricopeptide repeat protein [Duganella aceris]|uniref:tetratricopeptide repeat protein n=1 Tax=Duganella aceris TaxID=2703883 RepID=UPI001A954FB3|nr:sel1 repeat family protein [Duganella aceris]